MSRPLGNNWTASQLAEARRLIKRADEADQKARTKAAYERAKQLIGKYFRYDNGREFGYLYLKVVGVKPGWQDSATVDTVSFSESTNPVNGTQVERHQRYDARFGVLDPGYEEIAEAIFESEVRRILKPLGLMTEKDVERQFAEWV